MKREDDKIFVFLEDAYLVLLHYLHASLHIWETRFFKIRSLEFLFFWLKKMQTSFYPHYLHASGASGFDEKRKNQRKKHDFIFPLRYRPRFPSLFTCISPHREENSVSTGILKKTDFSWKKKGALLCSHYLHAFSAYNSYEKPDKLIKHVFLLVYSAFASWKSNEMWYPISISPHPKKTRSLL